jgi:hypothetical protein
MTTLVGEVIAGVDTHADTHHAAVIAANGKHLVDMQFPTTHGGYAALFGFIASFGAVTRVGIEGTGSYGAGLSRYLWDVGLAARFLYLRGFQRPNQAKGRVRIPSPPHIKRWSAGSFDRDQHVFVHICPQCIRFVSARPAESALRADRRGEIAT